MTTRHWSAKTDSSFQHAIAFGYSTQLQLALERVGLSQKELAERMNLSESRVSQLLNSPGNMTLNSMIKCARALGGKLGVVFYDDNDQDNAYGPIHPEVFLECWNRQGRPRDFYDLDRQHIVDTVCASESWGTNVDEELVEDASLPFAA